MFCEDSGDVVCMGGGGGEEEDEEWEQEEGGGEQRPVFHCGGGDGVGAFVDE